MTSIAGIQVVPRELSLHPVHLTPDKEGNIPPSALIPFCSYQGESELLGQEMPELDGLHTSGLHKLFDVLIS